MMHVLRAQEAISSMNHMGVAFGGDDKDEGVKTMLAELEAAASRRSVREKVSDQGHRDVLGRNAYRPSSPQEIAALGGDMTQVAVLKGGGDS